MKKDLKRTYNIDDVYDELFRRATTEFLEFVVSKGPDCKLTWDEINEEYKIYYKNLYAPR